MKNPQNTRVALFVASYVSPGSNSQELQNGLLGTIPLPQFQEVFETHDG